MTARELDGVPLFPDCRSAVEATGATTSITFVGAYDLLAAAEDAIGAGVRYLVTPTEGMPVHDALRLKRLVLETGTLWIGASTPGMAVPGVAKLGFLPDVSLRPGHLGSMSKSGTLSYEPGSTGGTRRGHVDLRRRWRRPVKGARYSDLCRSSRDEQTKAVIIIGEIGRQDEEDFAAALSAQALRSPRSRWWRAAPRGRRFPGQRRALVHGSHGTYAAKRPR